MNAANLRQGTRPVVRALDLNTRGKARALSSSLERQLLALCGERAREIQALPVDIGAPSCLSELLEQTRGECGRSDEWGTGAILGFPLKPRTYVGLRVPVSTAHSASTIWSGPRVNWLSRAWHDSVHIELGAEFDCDGELRTARVQCSRIWGKPERAIMWAETGGMTLYHAAYGAYPLNQRQFVLDCLRHGVELTIARGVYHAV